MWKTEGTRDAPSSGGWPGTWGCGPVLTPEALGGSAYPRLALTSSLDSQRNPSGWMKQSGPRGGEVGLDTQQPRIPPRASAPPGPGAPPSLSTGPPRPRSLGLDAHPPQRDVPLPPPKGQCPPPSTTHVSMVTTFPWEDSRAFVHRLLHACSPARGRCPPTATAQPCAQTRSLWPRRAARAPPPRQAPRLRLDWPSPCQQDKDGP